MTTLTNDNILQARSIISVGCYNLHITSYTSLEGRYCSNMNSGIQLSFGESDALRLFTFQLKDCFLKKLFLWWLSSKESTCQCRRRRFNPWVGKIPWRRKWQPMPVFLPGKSHGQRSLEGYSPRGYKQLDTTQRLNKTSSCSGPKTLWLPTVKKPKQR